MSENINYISFDEILSLHDEIIENIGGLKGYNEKQSGLLKSALEHIQNMSIILVFMINWLILFFLV